MSRVSQVGFDVGETHEMLITLRKVGFTAEDLNRIQEDEECARRVLQAVRGELVGALSEPPANLDEVFESQIARLIEVGAHKQVGRTEAEYREQAEAAVASSSWRSELVAIGLDKPALVDFSLSGEFLAKAGGVECHIDPDKCTNYQGVATPTDQILVIQGQWGSKYRNKAPRWCREHFHQLEQGCVVKEGLTVFLYEGTPLLQDCYMDFPGSVSESSFVPYLYLNDDRPCLRGRWYDDAYPRFGSASRGSV